MNSKQRRQQSRNQQMIGKTVEVMNGITNEALKVLTPAETVQPVTRIEFLTVIQYLGHAAPTADMELAALVNEGWRIAHETVNTYFHSESNSISHYRIVRLERTVDVVPEPKVEVVEEVEAPAVVAAVPATEEKVPPFIVDIVPGSTIVIEKPVPTMDFVSALRNPDMSVADVIEVGNAAIIQAGRDAYNARQSFVQNLDFIEVSHG